MQNKLHSSVLHFSEQPNLSGPFLSSQKNPHLWAILNVEVVCIVVHDIPSSA